MSAANVVAYLYLVAGATALGSLLLLIVLMVMGAANLDAVPKLMVAATVVLILARILAARLGKAEYHG